MSLLHFFAVLALAASAFAAPLSAFDCGTTTFFVDGGYLEKSFTLGPNANCIYEFNWRADAGAYITSRVDGLDADYATSASMYNDFLGGRRVTYGNQSIVGGTAGNGGNMYFAPGTVKLAITTGNISNVVFRMAVTVSNSTKDAKVQTTQVITGQQPIVITDQLVVGTTYVYTSTSKIVFAAPSPFFTNWVANINGTYWDSVFVYDGQGPNAILMGSLNQLYHDNTYVTLGNSLTLYPISKASLDGKLIINNQQNTGAFGIMQYAFAHEDNKNSSGVMVDSRDGPGTTSIVSYGAGQNMPADYPIITSIKFMDGASVMKVYSGFQTTKMTSNYIREFNPLSVINMSPKSFPGTAITFTVNRGYAYISYTSALTLGANK